MSIHKFVILTLFFLLAGIGMFFAFTGETTEEEKQEISKKFGSSSHAALTAEVDEEGSDDLSSNTPAVVVDSSETPKSTQDIDTQKITVPEVTVDSAVSSTVMPLGVSTEDSAAHIESSASKETSVERQAPTETTEVVLDTVLVLEDDPESTDRFLHMALIILSIATLISIAISFWLYRWRRLLLNDVKVLAPEEFVPHVRTLLDQVEGLNENFVLGVKLLNKEVANLTSKSENMTETYMSLHQSIDAKDKEIARLKSGYDSQIYKKFIKRFLKVDLVIEEEILESDSTIASHLVPIQEILQDALDECGVEKFSPEIGGQYKDTDGVADGPKIKNTDDSKKNGEISRVIEQGYRISVNEGFEVLVEAKVEIYHFNESGE